MTAAAYENGAWRCFELINGRYRHFLGCAHDRPRAAIRHTSPTYVSPLREKSKPKPEAS